jgi:hypothetical protein
MHISFEYIHPVQNEKIFLLLRSSNKTGSGGDDRRIMSGRDIILLYIFLHQFEQTSTSSNETVAYTAPFDEPPFSAG